VSTEPSVIVDPATPLDATPWIPLSSFADPNIDVTAVP
jgi:hypothetical protein